MCLTGFSTYFTTPSWQTSHVQHYLNSHINITSAGFNPRGRGFPDLSFIGVDYSIILGGAQALACGTSCSAPVFAAMVSLVNAERMQQGNASLGFLSPTIYATGRSKYFNDVTSGNNK
jgi:tripeptidyl-peptidase-1